MAPDCGGGSCSVVNSPDGTSVSILFDNFTAQGSQAVAGAVCTNCAVRIPLNQPPGYSLDVFRMDCSSSEVLGQSRLIGGAKGSDRKRHAVGSTVFNPTRSEATCGGFGDNGK